MLIGWMVERVATRIYRIMEKQEHGSPRMKRVPFDCFADTDNRDEAACRACPWSELQHLYERLVCYGSFFYEPNLQGVNNIFVGYLCKV